MLTWILIAIIVLALFGVINFDDIRAKLIELWNKYWPVAQKHIKEAQKKIEANKKNNKEDKEDQ